MTQGSIFLRQTSSTRSSDVTSPSPASPRGTRFPVTPLEQHQVTTGVKSGPSIGQSRAAVTANPAEQSNASDEAFDKVKAAATRDALLDEAKSSRLENRKRQFAAPYSPEVSDTSSPLTPRRMAPPTGPSHAPKPSHSVRRDAAAIFTPSNAHATAATAAASSTSPGSASGSGSGSGIHRTASLDSTASSLSSSASQTFKQSQSTSQEAVTSHDISALVQSTGSPEAAILTLLKEKQSVATHTDQMWRIMEKQRAMIFGLKSDLERALKDKDKYRRKLKEQLALSAAGQSLASALKQSATSVREESQSPTTNAMSSSTAVPCITTNKRKASDATDASGLNDSSSRSSTPLQPAQSPSLQDSAFAERSSPMSSPVESLSSKQPHAPLSASSLHHVTMPEYRIPTGTPPLTPRLTSAPRSPGTPGGQIKANHSENVRIMTSPQGFASPKDRFNPLSRKAPPAPLNLSPQTSPQQPATAAQYSDSEYEDDQVSDSGRGRQKTRADDDRQREAFAIQEQHGESERAERISQNKSVPPPYNDATTTRNNTVSGAGSRESKQTSPRFAVNQTMASMASHLHTTSDMQPASGAARVLVSPAIMSPGLPTSPRPGDRPVNSLFPRAPKQALTGMPMSPRDGAMPLSPRAPRGPLPLPPQTPMLLTSPSVARNEAYNQLNNPAEEHLAIPGQAAWEANDANSNITSKSPGEVYCGLVSEYYPGLLLPPNALPSILVKVDSSRLRPSRSSYMAPKQPEENPVFTLAIFSRSDEAQLWRVEKTLSALCTFDQQVKSVSSFRTRLPDRALFTGHAPARIDARRLALGAYFGSLLDTPMEDEAATIICGFLTADAFAAEASEYFSKDSEPSQPTFISVPGGRPRKDGYLTKRGKNFGGWKARYFVLDGPQLKYFEAPGGAMLGSIKLPSAQIGKQSTAPQSDEDIDNQYRHAFLILEPKRKDSAAHVRHVLCAESDDERDAWVECLLHYVEDEGDTRKALHTLQTPKDLPVGGRSPRLQKSLNDLSRPTSSEKDSSTQASLRSVPYQNTVAAEAPMMGITSLKGRDTPPPPYVTSPIANEYDDDKTQSHPLISAPTNGVVIQDVQSWGNKPVAQTPVKDKKRSIFGFGGGGRGRASSDAATGTSGHPMDNQGPVRPVFGVPLAEAVEFSAPADVQVALPAVAYRCIEYLKAQSAISEEGIFRLSGSNIVIKALRERFDTEGDIDLITDDHHYDVHAVASLLKQYLRELPANILTRDLHFEFLSTQERETSAKLEACNVLVNRLPQANRELLESLTGFLREIVDNEKVNKMSVRNVGIVFAPTLNIPATLISLFVNEHSRIFGMPVEFGNVTLPLRGSPDLPADAVRSPRKQMFADLPTPAYGQTSFVEQQYHQALAQRSAYDTGFIPVQQTYPPLQSQNEGGYGSRSGALVTKEGPRVMDLRGNGPTTKQSRRESSAFFMNIGLGAGGLEGNARRYEENESPGGKF